jgi:hypothetical protein
MRRTRRGTANFSSTIRRFYEPRLHAFGPTVQEAMMSFVHNTDVYQGTNSEADHMHAEYGFVFVLICMALALVVASAIFTPPPVGSGIRDDMLIVGP